MNATWMIVTASTIFLVASACTGKLPSSGNEMGSLTDPMEIRISDANVIAEVRIVDIEPVRFNTESGERPDPDNYPRRGDYREASIQYRPVSIQLTKVLYNQPNDYIPTRAIAAAAIPNSGKINGTILQVFPDEDVNIGDTGIMRMQSLHFTPDPSVLPPPWISYLRDRAPRAPNSEVTTAPTAVVDWYKYDGSLVKRRVFETDGEFAECCGAIQSYDKNQFLNDLDEAIARYAQTPEKRD